MIEKNILLGCSGGLHLNPAGTICETAMKYRCRSELVIGNETYNLRSVLSVLSAQMTSCKEVVLRCDGTDEADASLVLTEILEETPGKDMAEQD